MNSKLVSALSGVCVALILVIIGEWWYAEHTRTQLLTAVTAASKQAADDEMPDIDLSGQTEESYADLVARPLFIKGRKPVDEPDPKQTQVNTIAVKFDWVLNGVYTTKKGLSALFSRATQKVPKDNYRKLLEGGDLDGWKLTEIHQDHVVLSQDSSQKELLLRKPKLKQLPEKKPNVPPPPAEDTQGEEVEEPVPEPEPEFESPEETIENTENE